MILHVGNLQTTAMGILPHTDVERALELSLSLDIPFWPQLPRLHYHEDMYAQASDGFPGVLVDMEEERVTLNTGLFYEQLEAYVERSADPANFALSPSTRRCTTAFWRWGRSWASTRPFAAR